MPRWYLIYTKPRQEDAVASRLGECGFKILNAKIRQQCLSRGECRHMISPLFPRYLFVKMSYENNFHLVRYTRGVSNLVGTRENPYEVDEEIILEISDRLDARGIASVASRDMEPGEKVEIKGGPFEGLTGIFMRRMSGSERVSVLLTALNARIEINGALLVSC